LVKLIDRHSESGGKGVSMTNNNVEGANGPLSEPNFGRNLAPETFTNHRAWCSASRQQPSPQNSDHEAIVAFRHAVNLHPSCSNIDLVPLNFQKFGEIRLVRDDKKSSLQIELLKAVREGALQKAEQIQKKLIALQEEVYSKNSGEVALALAAAGQLCTLDGRFADAKAYYIQGIEVSRVAYGVKDNPMTAFHTAQKAEMSIKLRNWKVAADECKEAIRIFETGDITKLGDRGMHHVARTHLRYASALLNLGQKEEAAKERDKANRIVDMIEKKDKKENAPQFDI
jgi:tetratricopeptide (TPR) repeat protein